MNFRAKPAMCNCREIPDLKNDHVGLFQSIETLNKRNIKMYKV
jgi:hypothetical protein